MFENNEFMVNEVMESENVVPVNQAVADVWNDMSTFNKGCAVAGVAILVGALAYTGYTAYKSHKAKKSK